MISNSDYTQDYTQEYQLAEAAYLQGNYEKAATIIDTLVNKFHDDPSVRLLRGHIYCYGLYKPEIGKNGPEPDHNLTSLRSCSDSRTGWAQQNARAHLKRLEEEVRMKNWMALLAGLVVISACGQTPNAPPAGPVQQRWGSRHRLGRQRQSQYRFFCSSGNHTH